MMISDYHVSLKIETNYFFLNVIIGEKSILTLENTNTSKFSFGICSKVENISSPFVSENKDSEAIRKLKKWQSNLAHPN